MITRTFLTRFLIAWFVLITLIGVVGYLVRPDWFNDFYGYYVAAVITQSQGNPYDILGQFVPVVQRLGLNFLVGSGYSYPPFILSLFTPLSWFSPGVAAWLWFLVGAMLYVAFMYVQGKTKPKLFFLATFAPALAVLAEGQIMIWILILLYPYVWQEREDWLAALGLALAILIKVYPIGFVLIALLNKQYRFVGRVVCGLIGIILLSGKYGWEMGNYYLVTVLPKLQSDFDPYITNQSINGWLSRLWSTVGWNVSDFKGVSFWIIVVSTLVCLGLYLKIKNNLAKQLFWLGTLTLLAGKNSFWNFAPCVLIGCFILNHWYTLTQGQRTIFWVSLVSSWLFIIVAIMSYFTPTSLSWGRFILSSTGTAYLVFNLYLISRIKMR